MFLVIDLKYSFFTCTIFVVVVNVVIIVNCRRLLVLDIVKL